MNERITEIHVISRAPVHGGSLHGAKASLKEVRYQVNYHNTGQWPAPPAMSSVAFTAEDTKGITYYNDDPLVVSQQISTAMVHRILVDGGSSTNITFMFKGGRISCDWLYGGICHP